MADTNLIMAKWYYLTKAQYDALETKNPGSLYFLKDTKEIYRENESFSDIAEFVDNLPDGATVPISEAKIYVKTSDYSAYVYNKTSTKFEQIVKPVITDITAEGADLEGSLPTGNAVKAYVDAKLAEITGGGSALDTDAVKLAKDIVIKGQTLGGFNDGDTATAGTKLTDFLAKLAAKRIAPTYNKPTISVTSTPAAASVEAGTTVTPTVNASFTQRDGGTLTKYTLSKSLSGISSDLIDAAAISAFTEETPITVPEGSQVLKYTGTATYGKGAVKEDNLGEFVEGEEIQAGSVSATINWTGYRRAFYDHDIQTAPCTTSDNVRALAGTLNSPASGNKITINISANDSRITIAYPAAIRDITSVIDGGTGYNVVGNFVKTTVDVAGANAYLPISYKVFTFIPEAVFPKAVTYTVTI